MANKNKVLENIFDYSENENPLFESDNSVLGVEDSFQDNEENSNDNSCLPVGAVGKSGDSLPPKSIILKSYELEFESDYHTKRKVGKCKSGNVIFVQKAYGSLTLYKIDKDKSREEILSVNALSGDGGNGCIPDTEYVHGRFMNYYVGNLVSPTNFNDGVYESYDIKSEKATYANEHSWKLFIYEDFKERGLFRIHPTRPMGKDYMSNDGCISPYPIEDSVQFYTVISQILNRRNLVIPLKVSIKDNYNITVNIKNYVR